MRSLLPTQRTLADAAGHYHAGAPGQCRAPKPGEATPAGSFPAESRGRTGRLGHRFEPTGSGCESSVYDPDAGIAPAFSQAAASNLQRGEAMKSAALGFIRFYQASLSPALASSCCYYPSCSAYAYDAVEKWGLWRGVKMTLRRLLRCHPWGGHGYDPVP
jgi:hypothetical protein